MSDDHHHHHDHDAPLSDTVLRVKALERLVAEKRLASASELEHRKRQWDIAARNTPHGRPIVLDEA